MNKEVKHRSKAGRISEASVAGRKFIRMKLRDEDREATECVGLWRLLQGLLLGNHLKGFIRGVAWPDFKASFSSFWLCGQNRRQ